MTKTINGRIACTPFENTAVELEHRNAFVMVKQKVALLSLGVVIGDDKISKGSKVWVGGESIKTQWAKEVYKLEDGVEFILVPVTSVFIVEEPDAPSMTALQNLTDRGDGCHLHLDHLRMGGTMDSTAGKVFK